MVVEGVHGFLTAKSLIRLIKKIQRFFAIFDNSSRLFKILAWFSR